MKLSSTPLSHLQPLQFRRNGSDLIHRQLHNLLLTLNLLHTKLEVYNLQVGNAELYPLRIALHAQFQETGIVMTRLAERLRSTAPTHKIMRLQPVVARIDSPAGWHASLSNIVEDYEVAASQIAILAPLCHSAGDVMTLALLATIAESHGEAVSFYRGCMSSLQPENPQWNNAHS